MLLSPTEGPIPATVLPVATGLLVFAVGVVLLTWGSTGFTGTSDDARYAGLEERRGIESESAAESLLDSLAVYTE